MFIYCIAVANGLLNSVNKMVNVCAGKHLGTARGALINYAEASLISLILLILTGYQSQLSPRYILSVPFVFFTGSLFGLFAMLLLIPSTAKTGAALSTVLLLTGQMVAAILLDWFFFKTISVKKIVGIILIIIGILWREFTVHSCK